jgi:hypothetical protein
MEATTKNPTPVQSAAEPKKESTPKGLHGVEFYDTAEKAVEVGKSRTKGARYPVEITGPDGKKKFAVGAHLHYVGMRLITDLGYTLNEIGKAPHTGGWSATLKTSTDILAALKANGLPDVEIERIKAQFDALSKAPPAAKPAEAPKAPAKK